MRLINGPIPTATINDTHELKGSEPEWTNQKQTTTTGIIPYRWQVYREMLGTCSVKDTVESVDSLRRNGVDTQYMQYLSKSRITSPLKASLRAHASSLSAFVISKTRISGQNPHGRQLNAKVCGSESGIFLILSCFNYNVQQQYLKIE